MWSIYAIESNRGESYVGSSGEPEQRLREHNSGKCEATRGRQWEHVFVLPIGDRAEAYLCERWLKKGNTRAKRETIRRMMEGQGETFTAAHVKKEAHEFQRRKTGMTVQEYNTVQNRNKRSNTGR